jgi:hypothetical protein
VSISAEGRSARARMAALKRHHGDQADVAAEAAVLERDRLDEHIEEVVAAASRMTADQRARLAVTWRLAPEDRSALQRLLRLLFEPSDATQGGDGDGAAA